ncbi:unnamed protein product, partial [Tetraodon nigroviridis]
AEERACERARAAEVRVADLEQRVSELSEVLGSSEKSRQREQQVSQRLRERILQLDLENKTLAIAASSRSGGDLNLDQSQLDAGALRDKLDKLQKLLALAQRSGSEAELEAKEPPGSAPQHQQELRQLREEFERYKQRAHWVLKNKNAKDGCQTRELEEVRDQLAELKEKYINLRIQGDEAELQHRRRSEEQQQQALALQQAHRQEAERLEALHRDHLMLLEADSTSSGSGPWRCWTRRTRSWRSCGWPAPRTRARQVAPNEPTLLLYAEQLARKEVELGRLRRQKHRLEQDLHQLQAERIADAERHQEQSGELQGRLAKLLRDQNREGANMEYLKNVVYRFLTLPDASGRQQTLAAILTILHFSPQEKQSVMKLQAASWW